MTLYQIIKSLQIVQGNIAKQSILDSHKDNVLLKAYLKATYDPSLSYYQKAVPKHGKPTGRQASFDQADIDHAITVFAQRMVTGHAAKVVMQKWLEDQNSEEDQELCRLLIARSIGAGVGDTMVLKAFPDLYFIPPYMRCSLMTEKIRSHFSKLKRILVQKKADGAFIYLVNAEDGDNKGYTRQGSLYPNWLVERLLYRISGDHEGVFIGEALVVCNGVLLDRKTGNGILNSILSGDAEDYETNSSYRFVMEAWDHLSWDEFQAGVSKRSLEDRYNAVVAILSQDGLNVSVIQTDIVDTLEKALAICFKYQQEEFEGGVIKDPASPWKDHTSPFNIKVKVKFEAEYVITAIYEGEGKAKGMLGGISVETADGLLKSNCGTGFDDKTRKEFWKLGEDYLKGKVVMLSANDVITKKGSDTVSLNLPVYEELRFDKVIADSLPRVYEQLEDAKQGK